MDYYDLSSPSSTPPESSQSQFALNLDRLAYQASLPDILCPASREASPGFDGRVAQMTDVIEHYMQTDRHSLPVLIRLISGRLRGFVTGAANWRGEVPAKVEPTNDDTELDLGGFHFATDAEEEAARKKFEAERAEVGAIPEWVPSSRRTSAAGLSMSMKRKRKSVHGDSDPANTRPREALPPPARSSKRRNDEGLVQTAFDASPTKKQRASGPSSSLGEGSDEASSLNANADLTIKPILRSRRKSGAAEDFNFFPPSFPSDLQTSTPIASFRARTQARHAQPEGEMDFGLSSPLSSPPSASQPHSRTAIRGLSLDQPKPPTSQTRTPQKRNDIQTLDELVMASSEKRRAVQVKLSQISSRSVASSRTTSQKGGEQKKSIGGPASKDSVGSSTASSQRDDFDVDVETHPDLRLGTPSEPTSSLDKPTQKDAGPSPRFPLRTFAAMAGSSQNRPPKSKKKIQTQSSSGSLSGHAMYQSQFDVDGHVDDIDDFLSQDVFH